MSGTTEAFARVKIDALLKDAGWNLTDGSSVLFEHAFPDGTQADYVRCDRQGRPMAALGAKRRCPPRSRGRRKLLVEMATGTGKTRTAAAFIKRILDQLLAAFRHASISSTKSPALTQVGRAVMRAAKADSGHPAVWHHLAVHPDPPLVDVVGLGMSAVGFFLVDEVPALAKAAQGAA